MKEPKEHGKELRELSGEDLLKFVKEAKPIGVRSQLLTGRTFLICFEKVQNIQEVKRWHDL